MDALRADNAARSRPESPEELQGAAAGPILTALRAGNRQEVLDLLASGAARSAAATATAATAGVDVNEEVEGSTPALMATFRGWEDVVRALVDRGADLNVKSRLGETPLMRAVKSGRFSPESVAHMLGHGADKTINAATEPGAYFPGWTALHFASDASLNPRAEIVQLLLKSGADPNAADKDGRRPIEVARASNASGSADQHVALLEPVSRAAAGAARGSTLVRGASGLPRSSSLQSFTRLFRSGVMHHKDRPAEDVAGEHGGGERESEES